MFAASAALLSEPTRGESPPGAAVTTVGPKINASPTPGSSGAGNVLAITSTGQLSLNGVTNTGTANVVEIYYIDHTAWQENSSGNWYGPITSSSSGTAVASPLPVVALSNATVAASSPSGTTVGTLSVTTGLSSGSPGTGAYIWSYSLSGANAGQFQVVGTDPAANLETSIANLTAGSYAVTVTATAAGVAATLAVTITVGTVTGESAAGTSVTTVGPTIDASPTPGSPGTGNVMAITTVGQVSLGTPSSIPPSGMAGATTIFYDNFNTENTTLWNYGAAASVSGGTLQLALNMSYTGQIAGAENGVTAAVNMTDCDFRAQLVTPAAESLGQTETLLELATSASGYITQMFGAGSRYLLAVYYGPGNNEITPTSEWYTAPYPAPGTWLRMRHSSVTVSSGGVAEGLWYFETSPDGVTWTTNTTLVPPMEITSMYVTIPAGFYAAGNSSPPVVWDNAAAVYNPLSDIVQLYYIDHTMFALNTAGAWWGPITSTSPGSVVASPLPTISLSNNSVPVNSALGTVVGALSVTTGTSSGSPGTGVYTWSYALSGSSAGDFQVVSGNLETAVTNLASGSYSVTVTATASGVITAPTLPVTVTVGGVAESAPGTSVTTVGPTIDASPTPGTAGTGNVWAITSGAEVSLNGTANTATSNVVELYYIDHTAWQLNSAGGWYGPLTSSSTGATTVGSPVPTVSLSSSTVAANSPTGTPVGTLSVTTGTSSGSPGTGVYTWSYALSGTNASDFQVVSGSLETAVANLAAGMYTLTVTATAAGVGGGPYTLPVTVTVGTSGLPSWGVNAFDFSSTGGTPCLSPAATYEYLYSQGVRRIRLLFVWEDMQGSLGGALNSTYLTYLQDEIATAYNAGIVSIVDCHNWGRYNGAAFGAGGPTAAQFANLWTQLSTALKNNVGVLGYDLMNEPYSLGSDAATGAETTAGAAVWQTYSQAALTAIRNNGDNKLIHVEGYNYSNVDGWPTYHPTSWISDPANNFRYSAHDYPDYSGTFTQASNMTYTAISEYFEANVTGGENFATWNLGRLAVFTNWLSANGVKGDIGEGAWPGYWQILQTDGLPAATAASESALWNSQFAVPWLQALINAGCTFTYFEVSGYISTSWDAAAQSLVMMGCNELSGGGATSQGGYYLLNPINSTNSQYAAFESVGIWTGGTITD